MENMKRFINYFTKSEKMLWVFSAAAILISFCIFDNPADFTEIP